MQSTFEAEGWDFVGESVNGTEDIWLMPCEGRDYPSLAWQQKTCLFADVSSFNFVGEYQGANPVVQVLTIESIGPGGVNWQIDESCDWLEATPAAGFLEDGTTPITIAVDTTGLERGFYDCTMTVTGDTSLHFLLVGPSLFVVAGVLLVAGSLTGMAPDATEVAASGWRRGVGDPETDLPWYARFGWQAAALLAVTAVLVLLFA